MISLLCMELEPEVVSTLGVQSKVKLVALNQDDDRIKTDYLAVDNPEHSDFAKLRSALLRWVQIHVGDRLIHTLISICSSHLQDLKEITHDFLYENYRTEKLSKSDDKMNQQYVIAFCSSYCQINLVTSFDARFTAKPHASQMRLQTRTYVSKKNSLRKKKKSFAILN